VTIAAITPSSSASLLTACGTANVVFATVGSACRIATFDPLTHPPPQRQ
jgi:hypothetical protein